jgi:hypothetical protein
MREGRSFSTNSLPFKGASLGLRPETVLVTAHIMPKTETGRQRFPTRMDGAEAAVMSGQGKKVKIQTRNLG